ncbi:hypothetical protein C1885_17885 [Pseudomonas sp. GW531-R1]|nr:hypothetical protein C1885_17885 [Pseudomonas sp. GW531-R1]
MIDRVAAIGSKPPPTGECIPNVGGGLLPMTPVATQQNSEQVLYDSSQCVPTTPHYRRQGRVVAAPCRPRQPGR